MYPNPNHTFQLLLTFIFDSRGIRICTYTQSHLSGKSLFHTSVDSLSLWDTLSILFRAWAELQLKCWGCPSSLLFWPLLPLRWKQNNTIPHFHHPHSSLLATLWTEQKWKRTRWRHLRVSGFLEFHFPLQQNWPNLRTTFGLNPFGAAFAEQPRTESEASSAGW